MPSGVSAPPQWLSGAAEGEAGEVAGGIGQRVDRTYGASAAGGTDAGAGPRHGARAGRAAR
jgi:hypothetical protein